MAQNPFAKSLHWNVLADVEQPSDPGLVLSAFAAYATQASGAGTTTSTGTGAATGNRATQAIGAELAARGQSIALSSMFKLPTGTAAPATLILNVLDRLEYTAGFKTSALGALVGTRTTGFASAGGDAMTIGLVFTYQSATSRYYNASLGYFDQLKYTTSSNLADQVTFSLYTSANASLAASYAANSYVLMSNPATFTYQASVSVVNQAAAAAPPAAATPGGVIAAAMAMVGQAWNDNGCWVLASTIADRAGASLPASSTSVGIAGSANGEWVQAYNGEVAVNSNWTSLLRAGEIVSFVTTSGGGHITTVVSGSGTSAQLVDNMAVSNGSGGLANSAHDGQSADIDILAPHAAMAEFASVNPTTVCIYALDTPMVTAAASLALATGASASLAQDFSASNPIAGQTITGWQLYNTATTDTLTLSGTSETTAHSAATAFSVASLAGVGLHTGATAATDSVMARATNGSYWGDWVGLSVTVTAPTSHVIVPHL